MVIGLIRRWIGPDRCSSLCLTSWKLTAYFPASKAGSDVIGPDVARKINVTVYPPQSALIWPPARYRWLGFMALYPSLPQYQSSKTVKRQSKQQKMTIGVPIVTCLPRLYQQCTNRQNSHSELSQNSTKMTTGVPKCTKNSQKTVKTHKNDHSCTNRHRSTKTVITV